MNEFEKLVEQFRSFPGVGRRQAERFAHFITRQESEAVESLARSIVEAKNSAHFCKQCQRLTFSVNAEGLCSICSSPNRDFSSIMVVEKDADLNHMERAGVYNGLYFVLGGVLPMRKDAAPESIRVAELKRILKEKEKELTEVILALSLTPEGEYTSSFLAKEVAGSLSKESKTVITHLGRGLSVGSELEYSDRETLRHALRSRSEE